MSSSPAGRDSEPTVTTDPLGQVEVHAGSGVVFRRRDVLLVVPVVAPAERDLVAEMARMCAEHAGLRDRRHIRRLAWLITEDDADRVPGFACLTAQGDHVLVMAYGEVRVTVVDHPPVSFSATESLAWVERSVPATFTTLTVRGPGDSHGLGPSALPLDLLDGGVPGGGVTLHLPGVAIGPLPKAPVPAVGLREEGRVEEPAAAEGHVPPPAPETGGDPDNGQAMTVVRATPGTHLVSLTPRPADAARVRPPLPVGTASRVTSGPRGAAGDSAPDAPAAIRVAGIVCHCGEFNSPDSEECRTCGAPLDRDRPRETRPRPPLGILITDDGRVFTVTDDVVIGREPGQAPDVRAGRARPLVLRDAEQSTSRVHAQIRLSGWSIDVVDRGSANGTFISRSGSAGPWVQIPREPATPLAPGDRLRLGRRELLFDRYQAN
jgi:hypothetical protein